MNQLFKFSLLFLLVFSVEGAEKAPSEQNQSKPNVRVEAVERLPYRQQRSTTSESEKPKDREKNSSSPQSDPVFDKERPSLFLQIAAIGSMAFFPFAVMLLSPFMKFVVVLALLRTALGVQNSPPNMVINGIALMMSLFIMYPVAGKMYDAAQPVILSANAPDSFLSKDTPQYIIKVLGAVETPIKEYLKDNSLVKHQKLFYRMAYRTFPEKLRASLSADDFLVLISAYITSQLKDAFEIGVLIYIPFFVIDMVVSNILLAMGMMMLSPVTISMPLKLFLLVMLDGWTLLIQGLVQTFK